MQSGMAPPQGLALKGLRSKRKVSTPPAARASAAEDPAGPPPITAARSFRPWRGGLGEYEATMVLVGRGSEKSARVAIEARLVGA